MEKKPTVRLVAADLDNTLLDPQEKVSADAEAFIATLKERGVRFTLISGRAIPFMMHIADQLEVEEPMVALNGAAIFTRKMIIECRSIRMAPMKDLLLKAHSLGVTVLYYTPAEAFTFAETEWIQSRKGTIWEYQVHIPEGKEWEETEVLKVSMLFQGAEDAYPVISPLLDAITGTYSLNRYGSRNCEIMQAGVNKAQGLRRLSELTKIGMDQIMALGDDVNDFEMLEQAGIGVAVANASQEAKDRADYVAEGSNTLGVIEAIKRFAW